MRKPNGYGSIHAINKKGAKRRNPYRVRITAGFNDEGKQLFKTLGYFPNRKEAEIALAKYNANPYDLNTTDVTIKTMFEEWAKVELRDSTEKQVKKYDLALRKIEKFHDVKITDIRAHHILASMEGQTTFNRKLIKTLYSKLLEFAMKRDLNINKNYAKIVSIEDVPAVENNHEVERILFTKKEIKELWKREGDQLVDIILMLLYSGMRINEILKINREDIHDGYIIGGSKTEAGKNRVIPIHKDVQHIWNRYINNGKPYLFNSVRGLQLRDNVLRNTLRDSDIKHTFHDTRYTFISQMRELQVSDIKLKKIVGHADASVTDSYTKFEIESLIQEVNKLSYK